MHQIHGKATLFQNKFLAWLITSLGAFPVKRGTIDRESWKTCIDLIRSGSAVLIFPEGTRTPTGELQDAKPGTGMLAYQAKAPIVPVYMNTFDAWPRDRKFPFFRKRIAIIFGKQFSCDEEFSEPESKEVYKRITQSVMNEIRLLKSELESLESKRVLHPARA